MSSPVLVPSAHPFGAGLARSAVTARAQRIIRPRARPVVPADFRLADNPAAAVLRATVTQGPISRDVAARATGLSIATVNRQVTALLAAGLLRERADLTESGAIGRPKVPFEVDYESYVTVGIHIGAAVTKIIAADLRGRILGGLETSTPRTGQDLGLAAIARRAHAFADRWHKRRPLWVGVAVGGRVEPNSGVVDHPRLGWRQAPVGAVIGHALGLPVSVSAHVEAMAAAELLLAPAASEEHDPRAGSLYCYARETAGVALTLDGRVHTPSSGPGSIAHLPAGSDVPCECGRTGCLEATVSDRAVLDRAVADGIVPAADATIAQVYRAAAGGSAAAHELLTERAATLGRTVAVLRDMLNPDRVILGGQAFTDYPAGLPHVAAAFAGATALPRTDIRVSGFGNRVQEFAAGVTSLATLYADPLVAIRRSMA
jgi:predicted NBD/HSP70 family sugar kinase